MGTYQLSEIIRWTNYFRNQAGFNSVTRNPILDAAAAAKALDMMTKGYYSHITPDGVDPAEWVTNFGYEFESMGENIAFSDHWQNEKEIMDQWMASPAHKANILTPEWVETGIGLAYGTYDGSEVWFAVQMFGLPIGGIVFYVGEIEVSQNFTPEGTNEFSVFLRKPKIITDEDYQNICYSTYPFSPKPCIITKKELTPIDIPILYTDTITSDPDNDSVENTRIVKIGLKKFLGDCPTVNYRIGLQPGAWEPWNGNNDNICSDNIWEVGSSAYCDKYVTVKDFRESLYKFKQCDDPAESDFVTSPTNVFYWEDNGQGWDPSNHEWSPGLDPFYWYSISEGVLKSSFYAANLQYQTQLGIDSDPSKGFIGNQSWVAWYREVASDVSKVNNKRRINIKIDAWFEGLQESSIIFWSGVSIAFTDIHGNSGVAYLKVDNSIIDYWVSNSSYPQDAYQISQGFSVAKRKELLYPGDGDVFIDIRDYGLTGDLRSVVLHTESNITNDSIEDPSKRRIIHYECQYINLLN